MNKSIEVHKERMLNKIMSGHKSFSVHKGFGVVIIGYVRNVVDGMAYVDIYTSTTSVTRTRKVVSVDEIKCEPGFLVQLWFALINRS